MNYISDAILVYKSNLYTSLQGCIIHFIEFENKPIVFSLIYNNNLRIYFINKNINPKGFLIEILEVIDSIDIEKMYVFQYDWNCLTKYNTLYPELNILSFIKKFTCITNEEMKKYVDLIDLFGYSCPELFGTGFYNNNWYTEFSINSAKANDICNFTKNILFNKQILLIDSCTTFEIIDSTTNLGMVGSSVMTINDGLLIDLQTTGLTENSQIVTFSTFTSNTLYIDFYPDQDSLDRSTSIKKNIEAII